MEVFDTTKAQWDSWFAMPPMQTKRTLHAAAVANGKLYVCGGFDGMRDCSSLEVFDPKSNCWTQMLNMDIGRSYLALVAAGNAVYAIGGQDRQRDGPRAHL